MAMTYRLTKWITRSALMLVIGGFAVAGNAFGSPRDDIPWKAKDPLFGEALFDFYQGADFSAITRLIAAQKTGALSQPKDESDLLLGALYLSYDMPNAAQEIFSRLADKASFRRTRNTAAFYLARILFRQGQALKAEKLLSATDGDLPDALVKERDRLLIDVLATMKRFQDARKLAVRLDENSVASYYSRHNLAIAEIKYGGKEHGMALLGKLGTLPFNTAEARTLEDKTSLALGYAHLQARDPEEAKAHFNKIRLDGLLSSKALLGAGFAEIALGQHQRALVPWMELQKRDIRIPETQEAMLAVPDTLFKLESYKEALTHYQHAVSAYTGEKTQIANAIAAIRAGKLHKNILRQHAVDEGRWRDTLQKLPPAPENRYLPWLLENPAFQQAVTLYRDTLTLQITLQAQRAYPAAQSLSGRIETAMAETQVTAQKLESQLQQIAIAELERREQRLESYLVQANLAVAELYNHAAARGDE